MSDTLERRLRETMERRAGDLEVHPVAPPNVLHRARRRQAGTALVAGLVVVLVGVGSFLGTRAFYANGRGGPATGPAHSTVNGVTVSYPGDWYFENVAAEPKGGPSLGLFVVANRAPSVPFVQASVDRVCTPTSVLMSVLDITQMVPANVHGSPWPVSLHRTKHGVTGCGRVEIARWRAAGRLFEAVAVFGRDASAGDRGTLASIFAGMAFAPAPGGPTTPTPFSVQPPPGKTLAQGTSAGVHWAVVVRSGRSGPTLEVDLPGQGVGISVPRSPSGQVPLLSPQSLPLGKGPAAKRLVFGFVSARVSSVHIEPTHEIGKLYPISGERKLMAFVVVTRAHRNASVVAENEGGKVLVREPLSPLGPHPSPYRSPAPKASPSP